MLKKKLFEDLYSTMQRDKLSFDDLFGRIDINNSYSLDAEALMSAFRRHGSIINEEQSRIIFESMDLDKDGKVSYSEFQDDFFKVRNGHVGTLIKELRDRRREAEADERNREEEERDQ